MTKAKPTDKLTTCQAAKVLGVTPARVRQFACYEGLAGERFGRAWCFRRRDVDRYRKQREREKAEREAAQGTRRRVTRQRKAG